MTTAAVAQQSPIHHSTTVGYDSATTCGRVEQPKPSAAEWRYVTCPACLDLAPATAITGETYMEGGVKKVRPLEQKWRDSLARHMKRSASGVGEP